MITNKDMIWALRNSIQKFQPNIVFLSETKQKKRYLEKIKMKMKFTHCHYEDSCGLDGGLALWWSDDTQITILRSGKHFIDAMISINGETEWYGSFIYGPPYREEKQQFWEMMAKLRSGSKDSLLDLPISGGTFTWSNQRSDEEAILEKLDRALCSLEWSERYSKAVGMLYVAIGSDHAPIIILPQGFKKNYRRDFKFESKWLLEEDCTSIIQASWKLTSQPDLLIGLGVSYGELNSL
ncbi:hypothetical protein V6N12_020149 [Hibiscus sabdariffa]|uniref:Uncharacterized protein n=1 Tax=Hibiscus sabdariffa TaxID=183260 RepID=A0ABR1ZYY2_9ROSI